MSGKDKAITIRIPEERWGELFALSKKTGMTATSIARAGLYEKMEALKGQ